MSNIEARGGQIVPFKEQKLLVFKTESVDLVTPKDLLHPSEVYLGGDIFQGEYGVVSFPLVIPYPEPRPRYFIAEEGAAGDCDDFTEDELLQRFGANPDPVTLSHFLNTAKGFAVVRLIAAPKSIARRINSDRFLGQALIDKCSLEDTVPSEMHEELKLDTYSALRHKKHEKMTDFVDNVIGNLSSSSGENFVTLRSYPSWHNWRLYGSVMSQISDGCRQTVANFDQLLAILARDLPKVYDLEAGTQRLNSPDKPQLP